MKMEDFNLKSFFLCRKTDCDIYSYIS